MRWTAVAIVVLGTAFWWFTGRFGERGVSAPVAPASTQSAAANSGDEAWLPRAPSDKGDADEGAPNNSMTASSPADFPNPWSAPGATPTDESSQIASDRSAAGPGKHDEELAERDVGNEGSSNDTAAVLDSNDEAPSDDEDAGTRPCDPIVPARDGSVFDLRSAHSFVEAGEQWAIRYAGPMAERFGERNSGKQTVSRLSDMVCDLLPWTDDLPEARYRLVLLNTESDATLWLGEHWLSDGERLVPIDSDEYARMARLFDNRRAFDLANGLEPTTTAQFEADLAARRARGSPGGG